MPTQYGAARTKLVEETRKTVTRMQGFDPAALARTEDLGAQLDFSAAVIHADRLVNLYQLVSLDALDELSNARLNALKTAADADFNRFEQALKFSVADGNPKQTRDSLVQQVESAYEQTFEAVSPAIAYSVRLATDFAKVERDARAALQSIEDRTKELEADLTRRKQDADRVLEEIRKVAAEQGVSQQAVFFKNEAELNEKEAEKWLKYTSRLTVLLSFFAMSTLFLHKIEFLTPKDAFEAAQLMLAKALVFGTLASFLVMAGRNYLAHRHNYVVNKHRQNSLVTYKALVEAAGDQANKDVVLSKAAESIFGSQASGYTKDAADSAPRSSISLSPSVLKTSSGG